MNKFQIIVATTLGSLVLLCGCSRNPQAPARVSGKVKYKGQALPGGTIKYHAGETAFSAEIHEDGTYAINDLPAGDLVVSIETESLNIKQDQVYGGSRYAGKTPDYNPPGAPPRPSPDAKKSKYVKIPARYADPKSSLLNVNLSKGGNTKDFDLTD